MEWTQNEGGDRIISGVTKLAGHKKIEQKTNNMDDTKKKGNEKAESPPPKKWKNIDVDSFKFTFNFAAIAALIFSVYQLTNFVWTNYHNIDKQKYEKQGTARYFKRNT